MSDITVVSRTQKIVVNSTTTSLVVKGKESQKIVINSPVSSVSIMNAGPIGPAGPMSTVPGPQGEQGIQGESGADSTVQGPTGATGPEGGTSTLTVNGQLLTRAAGVLAPITRADLATDTAFTAPLIAHAAAADPHPVYLTVAEANALFVLLTTRLIPAGIIDLFAGAAAPATWVFCDGVSYLRSTYLDLFNALGGAASPWGLPDGTHFNVPDLRGRVPIGVGTGTGLTARAIAAKVGEETHLLTAAESGSPIHNHSFLAGWGGGALALVKWDGTGNNLAYGLSSPVQANVAADAAQSHQNMQPSLALNFIIKT
jgi:microcystin-dependent protein